ncbi:hypothetical protein D3C78_1374570 [compost metagenome]
MGELEACAAFRLLAEEFQQALVLPGLEDAGGDGAGEVLGVELEGHGGGSFPDGVTLRSVRLQAVR